MGRPGGGRSSTQGITFGSRYVWEKRCISRRAKLVASIEGATTVAVSRHDAVPAKTVPAEIFSGSEARSFRRGAPPLLPISLAQRTMGSTCLVRTYRLTAWVEREKGV